MDTTSIEIILPGISSVYGPNKLIDVKIKVVKQPDLTIKDGNINVNLVSEIAMIVRKDESETDEAVRYTTTLIT